MTAPIKVSPQTDRIIADASHFLGRTKKDLVDVAVREYVENHRSEINQSIRESMMLLDGSDRASARLLTGMNDAELDELGGLPGEK
jgi:hypothetical protein